MRFKAKYGVEPYAKYYSGSALIQRIRKYDPELLVDTGNSAYVISDMKFEIRYGLKCVGRNFLGFRKWEEAHAPFSFSVPVIKILDDRRTTFIHPDYEERLEKIISVNT